MVKVSGFEPLSSRVRGERSGLAELHLVGCRGWGRTSIDVGSKSTGLPLAYSALATLTGFEPTTSASTGRRTTVVLQGRWRSKWDSNPRTLARLRLSRPLPYHSVTAPCCGYAIVKVLVEEKGFEPPTFCLQGRCTPVVLLPRTN